jgi:hypothetical protein
MDDRSLRQLVGDLSGDLQLLCVQLADVARAETRDAVRTITTSLIGIAAGAFIALIGVLVLTAAIVLGLIAAGLAPWASALIVGAALAASGGAAAYAYVGRLRRAPIDLRDTRASLAETMTWLKGQTER